MLTETLKEEDTGICSGEIEESLQKTGLCASKISGVSMKPMLSEQTDRVITGVPSGRLKEGDVALYRRGKAYVLHRVIRVLPEGYLIRGDNCTETEKVPEEAVLGKLCEIQRDGDVIEVTDEMNTAFYRQSCRTLAKRKRKARFMCFLRRLKKYAGLA